jgi:hypothetical protein
MTDVYEFSEYSRDNLIYDFVTLTPEEREEKKINFAKFEAEKAAQKAAAPKPPVEKKPAAVPAPAINPGNNTGEKIVDGNSNNNPEKGNLNS